MHECVILSSKHVWYDANWLLKQWIDQKNQWKDEMPNSTQAYEI